MAISRLYEERRVDWHYITPGKRSRTAFAESFIGRLSWRFKNAPDPAAPPGAGPDPAPQP